MKPWLSVLMPSFRGEPWIAQALESVASEPNDGVEVLLIDGGPTAAARDIAAKFQGRLALRILERNDLSSWHHKVNYALEIAAADHVHFLCVDDVWLPGRANAVRRWIDAAPGAVMHVGPAAIIDAQGRRLGTWNCPLPVGVPLDSQRVLERLMVQNFIAAPAPVVRRDVWRECGGLDTSLWYTADWDAWLKIAARGEVRCHREVTVGFRIHGESLTVTGSADATDFARQMTTVLDRHLRTLGPQRSTVERVARASIALNAALAEASRGRPGGLPGAIWQVLALGPAGAWRYFRDSRIVERIMPRLRAGLRRSRTS